MNAALKTRTDAEKAKEQEAISQHYQEVANLDAKRQQREGVVVTPTEVVDFQIRSTIEQIFEMHGRKPHEGIQWLDPFGGSGIYTARLLQIAELSPVEKYQLAQNCVVVEIDPTAAQICADNLASVVLEETGIYGEVRVICTDTFALSPDADLWEESLPVVKPKINKNPWLEENFSDDCIVQIGNSRFHRKHGITDAGLAHFRMPYPDMPMTKTNVFFFCYGFLHSKEYQTKFANNLTKELPRIPRPRKYEDFKVFEQAGRDLAFLHLNFDNDSIPLFEAEIVYSKEPVDDSIYYVTKMKFGKNEDKSKDLTTIIYNEFITIKNIPLEAYSYEVGAKSAIGWVMDRQGVSTHKDSGITNDANNWAIETMGDPKYPLELLLRVITISLKTNDIVNNLPKLDIWYGK